jgi:hypothetical protein
MGKLSLSTITIICKSNEPRPFKAFFTADTPSEFTVKPSSGMLVPEHSMTESDNRIVIGYKPAFYGRTHCGTLLVETTEGTWIYELRGAIPKYQSPQVDGKRVKNSPSTNSGSRSSSPRRRFYEV